MFHNRVYPDDTVAPEGMPYAMPTTLPPGTFSAIPAQDALPPVWHNQLLPPDPSGEARRRQIALMQEAAGERPNTADAQLAAQQMSALGGYAQQPWGCGGGGPLPPIAGGMWAPGQPQQQQLGFAPPADSMMAMMMGPGGAAQPPPAGGGPFGPFGPFGGGGGGDGGGGGGGGGGAGAPPEKRADPRRKRSSQEELEGEPPLERASDLPAWRAWAEQKALEHEAKVHARKRGAGLLPPHALPDRGRLPVWQTGQAELGAQFGVGALLYFDLLRFCGLACFLGALLSSPALVYNLYNPAGSNYELSDVDSTSWLAFTTAGARLNCDADACRKLTSVLAAAELLYMLLLLGGLAQLRAHVRSCALQMDRSVVSISDFSVELLGLPPTTSAAEVRDSINSALQRHVQARVDRLEAKCEKWEAQLDASQQFQLAKRRRLAARIALGELRLKQCADFVERRRHAIVDVQLMVSNGRVLQQGLRKAPLEQAVEAATRRRQRLLALQTSGLATSSWMSRMRLSSRLAQAERDVERLELRLTLARDEINAFAADADHRETVGAVVTFEHEEGRLECLRTYAPWRFVPLWARDLLSLGVREGFVEHTSNGEFRRYSPVVARPVPEPSDLILHNIEHRGTAGNYARCFTSLLMVVGMLAISFTIVIYSNLATELTTFDDSICADYPVEWHDDAAASQERCGTNASEVEPLYGNEVGVDLPSSLLRYYPHERWRLDAVEPMRRSREEAAGEYEQCTNVTNYTTGSSSETCANVTNYTTVWYDVDPQSGRCKDCYCASIVRLFWARNSTAQVDVGETAWRVGGPYTSATIEYCWEQLLLAPLVRWGSTLGILAMNGLIKLFVYEVGNFERKSSFASLTLSSAMKLAVYQYFNTGIVLLVVRGGLPSWLVSSDDHCWQYGGREVCLFGTSPAFGDRWYRDVGGWLLLQMLLMIGTSNVFPFLRYALWGAKVRLTRGGVLTLSNLLRLHTGPRFPYAQRYGQVYCYMGLVLTYGSGMPAAYLLGMVYATCTYWTDKWGMLRLYRLPDRALDEQLMLSTLSWWKHMLLAHACFAFWSFRALPDAAADSLYFLEVTFYNFFSKWEILHPDELTFSTTLLFVVVLALCFFQLSVCIKRSGHSDRVPEPSGTARRTAAKRSIAAMSGITAQPPDDDADADDADDAADGAAPAAAPAAADSGAPAAAPAAAGGGAPTAAAAAAAAPSAAATRRRSLLRAQIASGYVEPDASDHSTGAEVARERLRRAALDTELGELEGLPTFFDALHGCFHPALRRVPQLTGAEMAVVHLHDVGNGKASSGGGGDGDDGDDGGGGGGGGSGGGGGVGGVPLLRGGGACNPFRCMFDAFGLETTRPTLTWEEWVAAPRYRVHLQGDDKTSYSAEGHPNYRDAFLGSEGLAEAYRKLAHVHGLSKSSDELELEESGPMALLAKVKSGLRDLEADVFTKG